VPLSDHERAQVLAPRCPTNSARRRTHARSCALVDWYNDEHHHVGLALVHPVDVHHGRTDAIVATRQRVLDEAHRRRPERFVRGQLTQAAPPAAAGINPPALDLIASTGRSSRILRVTALDCRRRAAGF
jgi:hypothetical protein